MPSPARHHVGRVIVLSLLLALAPAAGAQGTATVSGTVTDSARRAPLTRASVILLRAGGDRAGEAFTTTSGEHGEFTLSVPAGSYQLTAEHPALDSMESAVIPVALELAAGERREVPLATPAPATLKARACPGMALDSLTGAILGRVTDARGGGPVPGAAVVAQWHEIALGPNAQLNTLVITSEARADGAGGFTACGIPLQVPVRLQVQHARGTSGIVDVRISPRGVLARVFRIDTLPDQQAAVQVASGRVVGPDGQPIAQARVRIAGDTVEVRTDDRGMFRLRTALAGTQALEAVAIGYTPASAAVDLTPAQEASATVQLERTVAVLEGIRTVARRANRGVLAYDEFESRRHTKRGIYITPEMLAERNPFRISDLLRELPGSDAFAARIRRLTSLSMGVARPPGMSSSGADLGPPRPGDVQQSSAEVSAALRWQGAAPCPAVYVNGARTGSGDGIDALPPEWVYGVEIYRPSDPSPPQYENRCGVVIIWTKK